MYQHYLGVDLHRRRTYVVLMDKEGEISDQRRMPNDAMSDYVAQLPEKTFAVLEATGNWSYMYDVLAEGVDEVVLAHPKQVKAIGVENDILLAISTSGNSPNIISAVKAAKGQGIYVAGLSGGDGGKLKQEADFCLVVNSKTTARIQETHILAGHIICMLVDYILFQKDIPDD